MIMLPESLVVVARVATVVGFRPQAFEAMGVGGHGGPSLRIIVAKETPSIIHIDKTLCEIV